MDVLMPQLGETVAEGKISKWFVAAGDAVKPGDNLFEIETDKVSMEVPAIAAGTLAAIHVQAGEIAPVGAVVAVIQGSGETVSPASLTSAHPRESGGPEPEKQRTGSPLSRGRAAAKSARKPAVPMEPFREVRSPERNYGPARLAGGTVVTPLARRLAGEAGIDLAEHQGLRPARPHRGGRHRTGAQHKGPCPRTSRRHRRSIVLTADVAHRGVARAVRATQKRSRSPT